MAVHSCEDITLGRSRVLAASLTFVPERQEALGYRHRPGIHQGQRRLVSHEEWSKNE
jgi:hypothetical protein